MLRNTSCALRQVLVQPLHYQGDPQRDVAMFRKGGRGDAGSQFGTRAAPATNRPFVYDGPVNLPYWHHVADIWRARQPPRAIVGHHEHSLEGDHELTPGLVAIRPLLRNIIRHRNHPDGAGNALERWMAAKDGFAAGVFDKAALHRAGFFVLDVLAEIGDVSRAAEVYTEMHTPASSGGLGLVFDASHVEKMVYCCYVAKEFEQGREYFREAQAADSTSLLKTQTWGLTMSCCGLDLSAKDGLDIWDSWVFLGRSVHSMPPQCIADLSMGCVDEAEIARAKLMLRNFNDFYLEDVWKLAQRIGKGGMKNDAMLYYLEWLFKSRRHVILNPGHNVHFLRYAYYRMKAGGFAGGGGEANNFAKKK
eukprot:Sspe_Gene.58878::Locus_32328_Transcript_1_2_Confidence_0.667_Length_1224::g.58878::m.58878